MKNILKGVTIQFLVTFILYIVVYSIRAFIIWDLTNPFQWIIDIPTYVYSTRAGLLFGIFCYYGISLGAIYDIFIKNTDLKGEMAEALKKASEADRCRRL